MRGYLRMLAVGALSTVVALGSLSAPAAAKGKGKDKPRPAPKGNGQPDLSITKVQIKELRGTPPFITLNQSSRASGFVVLVTVRNGKRGTDTSGLSVAALTLEEKGKRKFFGDAFVDPLPPGKGQTVKIKVDGFTADLGFMKATVNVRWILSNGKERQESDGSTPEIPVIAQDWKVANFQTLVNFGGVGPSGATQSNSDLKYEFSRFDEADKEFIYTANGGVTEQARYNAGGCSGQGQASMTQDVWPGGADSELVISGKLTSYFAGIVTRTQPPVVVNVMCPGLNGFAFQSPVPWENLVTYTASGKEPSMSPDQTTLTDNGTSVKQTPVGELKFTWTLNARLSGA